jgi:hypothetical protein
MGQHHMLCCLTTQRLLPVLLSNALILHASGFGRSYLFLVIDAQVCLLFPVHRWTLGVALSAAGAVAVSAVLPVAAASTGELLHAICHYAVHLWLSACSNYASARRQLSVA